MVSDVKHLSRMTARETRDVCEVGIDGRAKRREPTGGELGGTARSSKATFTRLI